MFKLLQKLDDWYHRAGDPKGFRLICDVFEWYVTREFK